MPPERRPPGAHRRARPSRWWRVGGARDSVQGRVRGIDACFERYYAKGPRRRPMRVEFCEADVLDVFDEWRRAVGVGTAGGGAAAPGDDVDEVPGADREATGALAARAPRPRRHAADGPAWRPAACRPASKPPSSGDRPASATTGRPAARAGRRATQFIDGFARSTAACSTSAREATSAETVAASARGGRGTGGVSRPHGGRRLRARGGRGDREAAAGALEAAGHRLRRVTARRPQAGGGRRRPKA